MAQEQLFTMRLKPDQRELQAAVAEHYGLNESDTLRLLVRQAAREFGSLPQRPVTVEGVHHEPEPQRAA